MMEQAKTKRLYVRKSLPGILIACHKGAHYVSCETSVFTVEDRVVITGEKGDATVRVSSPDGAREEDWPLKGSYTGDAPASRETVVAKGKTTPPKSKKVAKKVSTPTQETPVGETETDRQLQRALERLAVRAA